MKNFTLLTLFLLCFGWFSHAQYADKGNGIHKSKIWWFDWNGFTLANNASRTFTTTDGLNVTITFSKVFAETLRPKQMNTWRGAVMWELYDFTNPSIMPAFYGDQTYDDPYFTMSVVATRNGLPVPFTFVTADAEASADVEVTTLTTNGGAWQTIDFFRNTSFQTNPLRGCNTQTAVVTNTFGGDVGLGESPLLATGSPATGPLVVDVLMDKTSGRNGAMGQAFGIFAPIDRGDLQASYGYVQHALAFNAQNSCNYQAPMPTLAQDVSLLLGSVPGDADGVESLDDNAIGADEDALSDFPVYDKSGTYSLNIPLKNTTGKDAWLTGYFDKDNDGVFGAGEAVTVRVPNNATRASLSWSGVPVALSGSVNYAFRFRLSSDRASTEKPGGYAPDGEVEDYITPLSYEVNCNNWLNIQSGSSGVQLGDLDVSGTAITVEALINRNQPYVGGIQYAGNVVSKHTGVTDCNYLLRPNSAEITTSNGYYSTGPVCEIELNKTYHIAMVYDGQKLKFYRNGYLLSEVNCTGTMYNNDFITMIGEKAVYPIFPAEYFAGYINEVRIWNVARSQEQIKNYMFTGLPAPSTQTGLLAYYTFDNLINKQGNASRNGILRGGAAIQTTNPQCTLSADSCKVIAVKADFTIPDTVCVNTPVAIINNSSEASTYYWNFCVADINGAVTGNNYGNIGGTMALPVYMDYAFDNGNYYGFVVNNMPGGLVRLNFGNSLLNTPVATSLGNLGGVMVGTLQGIQLVKEGDRWFAFVVGGDDAGAGISSRIIKLEFGTSLTNTPTATNWGNIGAMGYPHDLHMFKEGGIWYGLTVNYSSNTLTRFVFGNNFSSPPAGTNLGNQGNLSNPTGIFAIKDNSNWRVFVTNYGSSTLSRLDFGSSLANPVASAVNLGNPDNKLSNPRDLYVFDYCGGKVGFVVNDKSASGMLCRLNFSDFTLAPQVTPLPASGLVYPHSISRIYREGANLHAFVPDADNNTLTRISFTGNCTAASTASSTLASPPPVTYSQPGIYNINLLVDDGLVTQHSICKPVVVVAPPAKVPVLDTAVCADSVILKSRFTTGNVWNNNSRLDSLVIKTSGTYWVNTDVYGCTARDSFIYKMAMLPALALGNDTTFCDGGKIDYHFAFPDAVYHWQDGNASGTYSITTPGKYKLVVTNNVGCVREDSILVNVITLPVVKLMADTAICSLSRMRIRTESLQYTDSIRWSPATALSDTQSGQPDAMPATTTDYKLTAYNKHCSSEDVVRVTVLPLPVLSATSDTAVCTGQRAYLWVSGADTYEWSPASAVNSTAAATQYIVPSQTVKVYVKGTGTNGCSLKDSVEVEVVKYPEVTLMNDTTICEKDAIYLRAETLVYTDSVRWTPAAAGVDGTSEKLLVQPAASATYTLTAYNRQCSTAGNVLVTVMGVPALVVSRDTVLCRGEAMALNSGGAVSYNWSPASYLSQTTIANPVATPAATIKYYVTGTGTNGCTSKDSVSIEVIEPKVFTLSPGNVQSCAGDTLQFTVAGGDRYKWIYDASAGGSAATVRVAAAGGERYAVVAFDDVCRRLDTLHATVLVNELPVLSVTKSNDIDCVQGSANLTAGGASYYEWWPAATLKGALTGNPVARTDTTLMYHVKGTDMNGCVKEDSIRVIVEKNKANTYPIANAFTPNGDGLNDCFRVNKWGFIHSMELVVYNRFGERVFITHNPDECWDGRYKGEKQLPGTYVFTVKAQTLCGSVVKKGTVVLIR